MRTLMNIASTAAIAFAANAGTGSGGPGRQDEGPKDYRVIAGPRNSKDQSESTQVEYVITAASYKLAWELGREVTRSGSAQFAEDHHKDGAIVLRTERGSSEVPTIKPGALSVKSVESLQEKRSKKDALTVDRLVEVMAERNINMPKPLAALIEELQANGPAATSTPAEAPAEEQAAA